MQTEEKLVHKIAENMRNPFFNIHWIFLSFQ